MKMINGASSRRERDVASARARTGADGRRANVRISNRRCPNSRVAGGRAPREGWIGWWSADMGATFLCARRRGARARSGRSREDGGGESASRARGEPLENLGD